MNKKRVTSLLLLLSAITIVGAMSFSAGPILQEAIAQAGVPSPGGLANQTAANNAMSSFLPPGLTKSIIDQARNTNATKYALQHAIGATTAAMNKTAGMNATAAGMNKTAGMNATAAGMNATAAGMNKTAGMNATAAGMNKTAGMNATAAAASVLNITRNTNATSFAAHSIINATKNTTAVKH
ncbi:MAG TPA: hypothetical protein VFI73_10020 [Candidatus Nitrosopolaris sp.]|nr:hypothetical protein [Candidatus Nitrosopolaris sp.]